MPSLLYLSLYFFLHLGRGKQPIFTLRWWKQCYVFAFNRVLAQVLRLILSTEATVEVRIQLTDTTRLDLFSTFVVLESDLTNGPGSSTSNCTGNEITAKWDGLCSLFCQQAYAEATNQGCNGFA